MWMFSRCRGPELNLYAMYLMSNKPLLFFFCPFLFTVFSNLEGMFPVLDLFLLKTLQSKAYLMIDLSLLNQYFIHCGLVPAN